MFALASPLSARRNEEMTDKFYGGQEDGECQGYYSATDLSVLWHAIVDIWRGITCVAMFGREFRVNQIHREFVSDHRGETVAGSGATLCTRDEHEFTAKKREES